jgi:hypothetical protein
MKAVFLETKKSVGKVICHDITKIEKGAFKGALFKKGHVIKEEDVDVLLNLGKNHIYSLELEPGELHEDEAGLRIARALQGDGLTVKGPSEGRLDLTALQRGLLKVDVERLNKINLLPDVVIATLHTNTPVEIEEKVAGAKVIPLVVREEVVQQVEEICKSGPALLRVLPFAEQKIGVVITGREVIEGRVQDGFASVLNEKASFFSLEPPEILYAGDNTEIIANSINDLLSRNCEIIFVTGGMSVDPDDVTPSGIKQAGARIVKYGAPALPGAMFLLAYKGKIPILGIPACAMYFRTTILDIIFPRILAGETIESGDIAGLGHGGLCRRCEMCLYPNCSFGKGVV